MFELTVISPLLTNEEAARYLRLDLDHDGDMAAAVRALHKLVRDGKVRPLAGCGASYKFSVAELDRYIAEQTERFEPSHRKPQEGAGERFKGRRRKSKDVASDRCDAGSGGGAQG